MKFDTLLPIYLTICAGFSSASPLAGTTKVDFRLDVPNRAPQNASRILHQAFASLSVDPAFWVEFFGNSSHPNKLSFQLMKNVADRTGVSPWIRPGGVTQDSSIFNSSAGAPVRTVAETGGIYRTTYGPEYFKSFSNFARSTKFTVTLNLGNNSLDIARDQAKAAYKYLDHDKIWAFELGNEPGNYKATQRNLSTWGADAYVQQWQNWTSGIDSAVPLKQPRWWGGSDGTTDDPNTVAIQTDLITARQVGVTGDKVNEFSQHMYQYSSCRPASNARAIVPNIMNHTNITNEPIANLPKAFVDILRPKIAAAKQVGSDFVVGEYNSVSCSGKVNVTDIFGQALWTLDTSLYAASINVSRVYTHQGATLVFQSDNQANVPGANGTPGFSAYNLWYPRDSELRGRARANPNYASQLVLAEAIGKSGASQVVHVSPPGNISTDHFAAYAIYERKKLARLALINFAIYNKTVATDDQAPGIRVRIDTGGKKGSWLKRLTAPGLDEKNSDLVTWAGQAYTNGSASGKLNVEPVRDGVVWVRDSEAVLITV